MTASEVSKSRLVNVADGNEDADKGEEQEEEEPGHNED